MSAPDSPRGDSATRGPEPRFKRLLPPGEPASATEIADGFDLPAHGRSGDQRPYTILNMASTVDGRASIGGRSPSPASKRMPERICTLERAETARPTVCSRASSSSREQLRRRRCPESAVSTQGVYPLGERTRQSRTVLYDE